MARVQDRDHDGIADRLDNCPDQPGPRSNQGCPERQLVVLERTRLRILQKVHFNTGSATLQPRSYPLLDNVAAVLEAHPEIRHVEVQGHTDSRGPAGYNLTLSQRRAQSVVRYLVAHGVGDGRLKAVGHGETRPIAPNSTRVGRAANRRVEFRLAGGGAAQGATAPAKPAP